MYASLVTVPSCLQQFKPKKDVPIGYIIPVSARPEATANRTSRVDYPLKEISRAAQLPEHHEMQRKGIHV